MVAGFAGRSRELGLLTKRLVRVREHGTGVALAIRGRRQVGKSRLVQEFCDRSATPYFFFTATKGASAVESVDAFLAELPRSELVADPERVLHKAGSWLDAFRVLASALPDAPSIVVLDEVPWLSEQDPSFDGTLQNAWDRLLSVRPVLLILLGSDLHMMSRLTAYDRPFFGRADNLVLGPLNPAEVGGALGLEPADAVDAHLVTGGLPGIVRTWPHGTPALTFLRDECDDPSSPVFSVPESALLAEFPDPDQTRRVLEAVGGGGRTHAAIASTAGSRSAALPSGALSPILRRLVTEKQVLARDEPLSTRASKPALYRIADSNLRLYLAVLRSVHDFARRDQPDAGWRVIERRWSSWRGRAVEPLIREAVERSGEALPWPAVERVGGWWNRRFDPELDLVGADRAPVARQIDFVGSIKWLEGQFDRHDQAKLAHSAPALPGWEPGRSGLLLVSRSGVERPELIDVVLGPQHVVAAWRT